MPKPKDKTFRYSDAVLRHGFTKIPNTILDLELGLNGLDLLYIWGVLRYQYDRSKQVTVSSGRLAKMLGVSASSVNRAARRMNEAGLITLTPTNSGSRYSYIRNPEPLIAKLEKMLPEKVYPFEEERARREHALCAELETLRAENEKVKKRLETALNDQLALLQANPTIPTTPELPPQPDDLFQCPLLEDFKKRGWRGEAMYRAFDRMSWYPNIRNNARFFLSPELEERWGVTQSSFETEIARYTNDIMDQKGIGVDHKEEWSADLCYLLLAKDVMVTLTQGRYLCIPGDRYIPNPLIRFVSESAINMPAAISA